MGEGTQWRGRKNRGKRKDEQIDKLEGRTRKINEEGEDVRQGVKKGRKEREEHGEGAQSGEGKFEGSGRISRLINLKEKRETYMKKET